MSSLDNAMGSTPRIVSRADARPAPAQLFSRYTDGYRVAGVIVGFGGLIKVVGIISGCIIALIGLSLARLSAGLFLGGLIFGALVWFWQFIAGVLLAAQGQLLRATLDSAVNSSPLLNDAEKLQIMSLQ